MANINLSRSGVVDVIFSTLEFDSRRHGHTVETLLATLRRMRIIYFQAGRSTWTEIEVRLILSQLLSCGQLDMRSDGLLIMPESTPDPLIEKFQGAWYVTANKGVLGPFNSEKEAENELNSKVRT